MKRKFKAADLLDDDVPYKPIEDTILSISRWSIHHRIVFEREGKFWQTLYSEGATEMQEERPWEYEAEVECTEVELKEVTTKVWREVE